MASKETKNVIRLIYGVLILMAILFGTNPPARDTFLTYLVFVVSSLLVYRSDVYERYTTGIRGGMGEFVFSALVGTALGIAFVLVTALIPGFSLGVPLLPNAISDQLKFFVVVLIAPIVEEIFFRGAVIAWLKEIMPKDKYFLKVVLINGVIFSIAHVGAYVVGFYDYSSLTEGLSAVGAYVSVFIAAGIFAILAGFIVTRKNSRLRNLLITMALHITINFFVFSDITLSVFQ